ncbi:MAG: NUDIX hydrolase family protein [Candidatus Lutibacillus vidarii]|mgnify:FL=1|jgi:ADP-ribose pyrophosphatase YjhB (NUDIX family)|nr:NUDIX hydrolase family protein [Candidatus Lutibacillus vidarii]HRB99388.1 NUDIX hydrolase family protein [Dermatophilaceae bacterium]
MTKTDTRSAWLSPEELRDARDRLPIVYVDLVPVRVDERSVVTSVGLLLRASQDGEIRRELVSGRVLYHERIRDAIIRHIEKDLGPVSLPQVPLSPQPFTIAEYFPTPGVTAYHDPRQHAISLAFVVVVMGDCSPQQDALDLAWLTPTEACAVALTGDMTGGHGVLLRQAMAHLGFPI